MQFPRSHAWTPLQKWLIVGAELLSLAMVGVLIYSYERYHRGPTDSILCGTWQQDTDDTPIYYRFKPDHTFTVIDPVLTEPSILTTGKWYAGGKFIYLRFTLEDKSERSFYIWRIEDISEGEIEVRYNPGGLLHSYKRVESVAAPASNHTMQPTASPRTASL